jgi:putative exporter of polyketide antibiotics
MHTFAVMMTELVTGEAINWPATAGMLTVIVLLASGVGAIIAALVVKPMIEVSQEKIELKIKDLKDTCVSKDVFMAYTVADAHEHGHMQRQLELLTQTNSRGSHAD